MSQSLTPNQVSTVGRYNLKRNRAGRFGFRIKSLLPRWLPNHTACHLPCAWTLLHTPSRRVLFGVDCPKEYSYNSGCSKQGSRDCASPSNHPIEPEIQDSKPNGDKTDEGAPNPCELQRTIVKETTKEGDDSPSEQRGP